MTRQYSKSKQIVYLILCLLGFGIMWWSAADWFQLSQGERFEASFCSINSYWNCDRATLSPFGSWAGVPVGIFGALWFFVVFILGVGPITYRKFLRPLYIAGILVAGLMAAYLFFQLRAGCIVCLSTYALVIAVSIIGWPASFNSHSVWVSKSQSLLAVGVGVLVLGLYGFYGRAQLDRSIPEKEFSEWFDGLENVAVPTVSPFVKGRQDAAITVVEFSDFGCPHCARFAQIVVPYLSTRENVRVMFYPYPLDSACNSKVQRSVHPQACDWSRASLCAQQQDKFWPFHDKLFKMATEDEALPSVQSRIHEFNLDLEVFNSCMKDPETEKQLKALVDIGNQVGIPGTPAIFVNGKRIDAGPTLPLMRRVVERLSR